MITNILDHDSSDDKSGRSMLMFTTRLNTTINIISVHDKSSRRRTSYISERLLLDRAHLEAIQRSRDLMHGLEI
jgi:hypothetical protein